MVRRVCVVLWMIINWNGPGLGRRGRGSGSGRWSGRGSGAWWVGGV